MDRSRGNRHSAQARLADRTHCHPHVFALFFGPVSLISAVCDYTSLTFLEGKHRKCTNSGHGNGPEPHWLPIQLGYEHILHYLFDGGGPEQHHPEASRTTVLPASAGGRLWLYLHVHCVRQGLQAAMYCSGFPRYL